MNWWNKERRFTNQRQLFL